MLKSLEQTELAVTIGQFSSAGQKPANQDFFGAIVPEGPARALKGVALAIADGITPSPVSHIASETAVKSFLSDYYCTSDAWTVKTAAGRVISATNSWLSGRNAGIEDRDQAYITTFSALVLKGRRAHIFHIGDSRIWRRAGDGLEVLTTDHRISFSSQETYLGRALGLERSVEIDHRVVPVSIGDIYVMTTDGVHEYLNARDIVRLLDVAADLDSAAAAIADAALAAGSMDNLTVQLVRVDGLPADDEEMDAADTLPPAPIPAISSVVDGYRIVREIHASSRSHIFLAVDEESGEKVALKFPSADLRSDPGYLRRFAAEEWIARRINSEHVLAAMPVPRERQTLYIVTEYLEGRTLRQWMADTPDAPLEKVRDIIEQIARGLQAFHRKDMIHQDLRPENVMIDNDGTAKIIDFGAVRVAGIVEALPGFDTTDILGTHQYAAPEYFNGQRGTESSDIYSLGAMAYEMLTGRLPYGASVAQGRELKYRHIFTDRPDVPAWVDGAVRKAVQPDPGRRYEALSEFTYDLRHPNAALIDIAHLPLSERKPLLFWKLTSLVLAVLSLALAARLLF